MSPISILKSTSWLKPGRMLDVGARDCTMAGLFADIGYEVDAIDPSPLPEGRVPEGVKFRQTTLEEFAGSEPYDLVVASMVSHLVSYDIPDFLARLRSLMAEDGLIYVTLLGEDDAWAGNPNAKVLTSKEACDVVAQAGLKPTFRSIEWFEGSVYSGDRKYWHLYRFLLGAA